MLIFPLNFLLTNKSVSLIVKFEGDTIFMSIFKANFVTVQYEYFNIKKHLYSWLKWRDQFTLPKINVC